MSFPYTAFDVLYHRLTEYREQGAIGSMWLKASGTRLFDFVALPEADMVGFHTELERMSEDFARVGRRLTRLTLVFDKLSLLMAVSDPFELGIVVRRHEALPHIEHLASAFFNGDIARSLQQPPVLPSHLSTPETMPTASFTPDLIPSLTAVKELGFTSQPAALWVQFRRRFEGLLSEELDVLQAARLLQHHERQLAGDVAPEPWTFLPFSYRVLEALPDRAVRERLSARVKDLVADLLAAS